MILKALQSEERESRARTRKGVRSTDEELQLAVALMRYLRFNTLADLLHEASIMGMLMLATKLPERAELPEVAGRELPAQLRSSPGKSSCPSLTTWCGGACYLGLIAGGDFGAPPAGITPMLPAPPPVQEPGPLEVDQEATDYLDTMGSTLLD